MLRADSAFYNHDVIAAVGRRNAYFSITARQDRAVRAAMARNVTRAGDAG